MNGIDFVIILLVACLIFFAVRHIKRTAKKGGCAGCSGCGGSCSSCNSFHGADKDVEHIKKQK